MSIDDKFKADLAELFAKHGIGADLSTSDAVMAEAMAAFLRTAAQIIVSRDRKVRNLRSNTLLKSGDRFRNKNNPAVLEFVRWKTLDDLGGMKAADSNRRRAMVRLPGELHDDDRVVDEEVEFVGGPHA